VTTSRNGLNFILDASPWRPEPYDTATGKPVRPGDPVQGTLAIGVGHTGPDVVLGMRASKQEMLVWLKEDIRPIEQAVQAAVKVPLTQNQFDALVSFVLTVGVEEFLRSTLLVRLNLRDYGGAANEFLRWVYRGGRPSDKLLIRRQKERRLFLGGATHPTDTTPRSARVLPRWAPDVHRLPDAPVHGVVHHEHVPPASDPET
jgi:lysozyme